MKEEEIKELKEYFAKQPVILVYLFGSYAKKKEKTYSDIDIAVFFANKLSDQERFDLKLKVISNLTLILKTDKIDVVDLQDASPFLKFEAIKQRQEIFIKDESKRVEFERKVLSEYFDRQYYLRRHVDKGLEDFKKEYGITTR